MNERQHADCVADLVERLERAVTELDKLTTEAFRLGTEHEWLRLRGKASGVRMALGYIREMRLIDGHAAHAGPFATGGNVAHTDGRGGGPAPHRRDDA